MDKLNYGAIPTIPAGSVDVVSSDGPSEYNHAKLHSDTYKTLSSALDISLQFSDYVSEFSSEDDDGVQHSEDDDLKPFVQVLYPHDSAFEPSEGVSELCSVRSTQPTKLMHLDDAETILLEPAERKSCPKLTPRQKVMAKLPPKKKKSLHTVQGKYEIQSKIVSSLLGMNSNTASMVERFTKSMPVASAQFLALQLLTGKKQRGRRKWTAAEKVLALTVYKRWPSCYRLMTRMCVLPKKTILLKMMEKVTLLPGLNENIFHSLAETVADMNAIDRTCILLFDKVSVCRFLEYDGNTDTILGFQTLGEPEEALDVADHALVFMLKGLNRRWKQPVVFHFTAGKVSPDGLAKLLGSVLHKCRKTGLNVIATVCDAGSNNVMMLKLMGASQDRPYFYFENQKIITLYDVPHLLRYLRNILLKHDILVRHEVNGEMVESKASWSVIRAAYDIDRQQLVKRLHKLTDDHVAPRGLAATSVAVAAQMLSHTMETTISEQVTNGDLDASALATAHLVGFCNRLFDSLNGSSGEPQGAGGLRCRLCRGRERPHLQAWSDSLQEIRQWKVEVNSRLEHVPPPCQSGWVSTLEGMTLLWGTLKTLGFKYLEPRSINLDTLQNLFRSVRSNRVSGTNPTVREFVSAVKASLMDSLVVLDVDQMNCCKDDDTGEQLSELEEFVCCAPGIGVFSLPCVACGVARKLALDSDCNSCEQAVCSGARGPGARCGFVFKACWETEDGLTYPSTELLQFVSSAVGAAWEVLSQVGHRGRVRATVLSEMKERLDSEWVHYTCPEHADALGDKMLSLVCRYAIEEWCSRRNYERSNVV